jgi:outer membrane protein OmpU
MNKLKKVGLSALAGSLVAFSAANADMSVSGGASIGVSQQNDTLATGNYHNNSVKFTFSGETDSGLTVTQYIEIDGGAQDDAYTKVAGDFGSLTFQQNGGTVMSGWDDKTPTAYEEVWDIAELASATAGADVQIINGGGGGANSFKYVSPTVSGVTLSAAYVQGAVTASAHNAAVVNSHHDIGVEISPEMVEGLTIGYGMGEVDESATITNDESTLWITYAFGPVTVGYQSSEVDGQTATQDDESVAMSVVYAVNDDLSISYGTHEMDFGSSGTDQESKGFAVSYSMGGVGIAFQQNTIDNVAGSTAAANDIEGYDLNVSFSF